MYFKNRKYRIGDTVGTGGLVHSTLVPHPKEIAVDIEIVSEPGEVLQSFSGRSVSFSGLPERGFLTINAEEKVIIVAVVPSHDLVIPQLEGGHVGGDVDDPVGITEEIQDTGRVGITSAWS